ncbi:hypothetical protein Pelo_12656 [Pelomyxa schiedti]|nr:hypothetical protein Pelo_12656 [Pelomyxa schiedti]
MNTTTAVVASVIICGTVGTCLYCEDGGGGLSVDGGDLGFIVDCGATQPEFDPDMSANSCHSPNLDPDVPWVDLDWTWSPSPQSRSLLDLGCSNNGTDLSLPECVFFVTTDWDLRLAGVSTSDGILPEAMTSTVAVAGLPVTSVVQLEAESGTTSGTFRVEMVCQDQFVSSVAFLFVFTCGYYVNSSSQSQFVAVAYEDYTFDMKWDCYIPGCTEWCDEHGTCMYEWGYCECDENWSGMDCQLQWHYNHMLCPAEPLNVTFSIPAIITT